jgi:hypothetical protein
MKKFISFSLWGDNPIYTQGAIRNAEIAEQLFPGWTCCFFCFESVPSGIIEKLANKANALVIPQHGKGDNRGMFARFQPAEWEYTERFICRDTDSRLSPREVLAVNDWIEKDTDLHVMRDHPYHGIEILGGMWGAKGGKLKGITAAAREFAPSSQKGQDQSFLVSWVWKKSLSGEISCTMHDPFFAKISFPQKATRGLDNMGVWFVGQVFDEMDIYNSQGDVDILRQAMSQQSG